MEAVQRCAQKTHERRQTHFVFRIFQVEHEGPVFVLVLAVCVQAEVEHFLLNGNRQSAHLTLCHFKVIAVTDPGGNMQTLVILAGNVEPSDCSNCLNKQNCL